VPSSDCVNDQIVNEASNIQYFGQIDTPDEMDDLLNELPGGKAPVLTEEELAAKTRMEELARQACSETPVGNLTAQEWGRAVHSRLEQLIDAERLTNEKFFGEVGYLNGDVINGPVTGTKWPLGSSRPDAGFGLDKSQPQLLFDLKTGVKGLVAKWLSRLSINLPKGFEGTPVFKLTC
jgi:hypothetical protein